MPTKITPNSHCAPRSDQNVVSRTLFVWAQSDTDGHECVLGESWNDSFLTDFDKQVEEKIHTAGRMMKEAYSRYVISHDMADRQIAIELMNALNNAIRGRSLEVQALRHAELEKRIDEGIDYFAVMGAKHSRELRV